MEVGPGFLAIYWSPDQDLGHFWPYSGGPHLILAIFGLFSGGPGLDLGQCLSLCLRDRSLFMAGGLEEKVGRELRKIFDGQGVG